MIWKALIQWLRLLEPNKLIKPPSLNWEGITNLIMKKNNIANLFYWLEYQIKGWFYVWLSFITIWIHGRNKKIQLWLNTKLESHGNRAVNIHLKSIAKKHAKRILKENYGKSFI